MFYFFPGAKKQLEALGRLVSRLSPRSPERSEPRLRSGEERRALAELRKSAEDEQKRGRVVGGFVGFWVHWFVGCSGLVCCLLRLLGLLVGFVGWVCWLCLLVF